MNPNRPTDPKRLLSEYYLASPPPAAFLRRHLFGNNRRLLLQLQKVATTNSDTRGRAVPAYDVRCSGSFVRRLTGCFKNDGAKEIVIVAAGSDESDETGAEQINPALATITRVHSKDAEGGSEKLVVKFFEGTTWSFEQAPSGGYQLTPLDGADQNVVASWDPESGSHKRYRFSISESAVGSESIPGSPTPKSPIPKFSDSSRKRGPDFLARMDAERVQVFTAPLAPRGSFLGKMDEKSLEQLVLISGICVRALQKAI